MNLNELFEIASQLKNVHEWHAREQSQSPLHPAIVKAINEHHLVLSDAQQLVLEWPHVSEDTLRLAFTRSIEHGALNRQTLTSVGKYLTRHFPDAKSDVIRDIASLYTVSGCEFTDRTTEAYVLTVLDGPSSCMKWSDQDRHDLSTHPYQVYGPELGWHMAIHRIDQKIWGRCLCLEHGDRKIFVRSYHGNPQGQQYSQSDVGLEAWLKEQGYEHQESWPSGARLRRIEDGFGHLLAPYLDGTIKSVFDTGNYLKISCDGDLTCDCTNGQVNEDMVSCDCCGEDTRRDNLTSAGRHDNIQVCQGCIDESYHWVYGYRGQEYYLHEDSCVRTVDGSYYDEQYLSDNGIVEIDCGSHEGDYAHENDTLEDYQGNRWHDDDEDHAVVMLDAGMHAGEFANVDETWVCHATQQRYSNDDPYITVADKLYNPNAQVEEDCEGVQHASR